MIKQMKNQQIHDLADVAANHVIAFIQNKLGQTDGGLAGLYFSDNDRWDRLINILSDYIQHEIMFGQGDQK
jgi:hypothetical protein